jgi:hypothetical protein
MAQHVTQAARNKLNSEDMPLLDAVKEFKHWLQ